MKVIEKVADKIRADFYVDGENGRYMAAYDSKIDVLEHIDRQVLESEISSYVYRMSGINELSYPIIIFYEDGSPGGRFFDEHSTYDDIYRVAKSFFLKK